MLIPGVNNRRDEAGELFGGIRVNRKYYLHGGVFFAVEV
jgi:hypothetical protein